MFDRLFTRGSTVAQHVDISALRSLALPWPGGAR